MKNKIVGQIIRFSRLLIVQAEVATQNVVGLSPKVLLCVDVRRSSVEPATSRRSREQHLHRQQAGQPSQHRLRHLREDVGSENVFGRKNFVLHQRVRRNPDALFKVCSSKLRSI